MNTQERNAIIEDLYRQHSDYIQQQCRYHAYKAHKDDNFKTEDAIDYIEFHLWQALINQIDSDKNIRNPKAYIAKAIKHFADNYRNSRECKKSISTVEYNKSVDQKLILEVINDFQRENMKKKIDFTEIKI